LAHQRWAIEQNYQDFKSELGLDHFVWATLTSELIGRHRKENPSAELSDNDSRRQFVPLERGSSRRTTVMRYPTGEY